MTSLDTRARYLNDLTQLFLERARRARSERDAAPADEHCAANATIFAFHEVVSLMQQQAIAFGIPLEELGLDQIDPERDLL